VVNGPFTTLPNVVDGPFPPLEGSKRPIHYGRPPGAPARPARAYAVKREHPGRIPPCRLWPGTRDKGKQALGPHPSPLTPKSRNTRLCYNNGNRGQTASPGPRIRHSGHPGQGRARHQPPWPGNRSATRAAYHPEARRLGKASLFADVAYLAAMTHDNGARPWRTA
jgi:hypothetical protein